MNMFAFDPTQKHTITRGTIEDIMGILRDIDRQVAALKAAGADAAPLDKLAKDSGAIYDLLNRNTPVQD